LKEGFIMQVPELPFLSNWQNFYMILGTAAATLTGLMFVAMTLLAGIETHMPTLNAGVSAFNTPTVAHFCAVLLIAGILSAPWQAFSIIGLLLGLLGLGMVSYLIVIMRQMKHIPNYQPDLHDWLWYMVFPFISYIALIVAAVALPSKPMMGLYIISAAMVALLFLGIHNAWDLVTYFAVERSHSEIKSREKIRGNSSSRKK
jgi:hypothetical protein